MINIIILSREKLMGLKWYHTVPVVTLDRYVKEIFISNENMILISTWTYMGVDLKTNGFDSTTYTTKNAGRCMLFAR